MRYKKKDLKGKLSQNKMTAKALTEILANNIKTLLVAGALAYKTSTCKFFNYISQRKSKSGQEIHPLYPQATSRQEATEYWLEENDKLFKEPEAKPTEEELDELRHSYGSEKIQVLRNIRRRLGQI